MGHRRLHSVLLLRKLTKCLIIETVRSCFFLLLCRILKECKNKKKKKNPHCVLGCSRVNPGLLRPDLQQYNIECGPASELEAATHLIFYYYVDGIYCGWNTIIFVRLLNPNGSLFRLFFSQP